MPPRKPRDGPAPGKKSGLECSRRFDAGEHPSPELGDYCGMCRPLAPANHFQAAAQASAPRMAFLIAHGWAYIDAPVALPASRPEMGGDYLDEDPPE